MQFRNFWDFTQVKINLRVDFDVACVNFLIGILFTIALSTFINDGHKQSLCYASHDQPNLRQIKGNTQPSALGCPCICLTQWLNDACHLHKMCLLIQCIFIDEDVGIHLHVKSWPSSYTYMVMCSKAVPGIQVTRYPTETGNTRFHFSVPITRRLKNFTEHLSHTNGSLRFW